MRKCWGVLIGCISLFTSYIAYAKEGTSKTVKGNSLLWKVTGNEMKKPSYIFGTMHIICKDDYLWTPVMAKSLKASEEVCFEMDMDDPSVMLELAAGMIDNSGKQLKEYFTDEDYSLVEKYFTDSLGINAEMISQLKPAALVTLLATSSFTCSNMVSYENNIMQKAQEMKIEVTGLEYPQEQLALLESLPIDSIVKEVITAVQSKNNYEQNEYTRLVSAYKKQDVEKLHSLMIDTEKAEMNLDAFLDERNNKWIDRMEERMDQKPVFFAVGAGHLWGNNGIINLLRNKGYKVVPVR